MNPLQETLLETALSFGYQMGQRNEHFSNDSRCVLKVICEESKAFENDLVCSGNNDSYMDSVEHFANALMEKLRHDGLVKTDQ